MIRVFLRGEVHETVDFVNPCRIGKQKRMACAPKESLRDTKEGSRSCKKAARIRTRVQHCPQSYSSSSAPPFGVLSSSQIGPSFHFDVEEVDFGQVSYDCPVSASIVLTNTSDIPMRWRARVPQVRHTLFHSHNAKVACMQVCRYL